MCVLRQQTIGQVKERTTGENNRQILCTSIDARIYRRKDYYHSRYMPSSASNRLVILC